jgi:Circularly permutated YpsA SLOG family
MNGGQATADRTGLDFAIEAGFEHGEFVPRGHRAEDGKIPEHYQLTEFPSISYAVWTSNVREAACTVKRLRAPIVAGRSPLSRSIDESSLA